jgi:hypothetical protein
MTKKTLFQKIIDREEPADILYEDDEAVFLRKIFQMAEKEAKRALEVMANSIEKRIAEARKAEVQLVVLTFAPRFGHQMDLRLSQAFEQGQQALKGEG